MPAVRKHVVTLKQYGVLPFFLPEGGEPCFLLITSRDTGRWVVPRGGLIRRLSPVETAAREAYEEAGLKGLVGSEPIGSYDYLKRRKHGASLPASVELFPLQVTGQSRRWPERGQREIRWFTRERAVAAVEEPGLKRLIADFEPPALSASDAPLPVPETLKRRVSLVSKLLRR